MDKSFREVGPRPTLYAAFLYFDLAFMVWVMLGPLGVQIAGDLGLTHVQKGMMVATPVLAGAFLRLFMGVLVDHLKPKLVGAIGQMIVLVSLFIAWYFGIHSDEQTLLLGGALGVAGASFAVALPLASRGYPPEHQGAALAHDLGCRAPHGREDLSRGSVCAGGWVMGNSRPFPHWSLPACHSKSILAIPR